MPAAKELLEWAKEHLDDPPQPIDLRDEFGRQIEPIRDKSKHAVKVWSFSITRGPPLRGLPAAGSPAAMDGA